MAGIPTYSAARSGVLGDPGAVNTSAGINQLLGAHGITAIYTGNGALGPTGQGATTLSTNLGTNDWDQSFTFNHTATGRAAIPVTAAGNGADLIVSFWTDSAGSPGTMIVSTRVAAKMLTALVATAGLAAASAPPLATATNNALIAGPGQLIGYAVPAISPTTEVSESATVIVGDTMLLVGGADSGGTAVPNVFSINYLGSANLAPAVPQPTMPIGLKWPGAAVTSDTLVVAGGTTGTTTDSAAVYTANLNPANGNISSWSAQTSLPAAISYPTVAASGQHIYVLGGQTGGVSVNTVSWTTVQNGQITGWQAGPPLPAIYTDGSAFVINGFLIALNNSGSMWYSAINADGSLSNWHTGPTAYYGINRQAAAATGTGIVTFAQYFNGTSNVNATQTLTVGPNGPAAIWRAQNNTLPGTYQAAQAAMFPSGNGTWQIFTLFSTNYYTQQIQLVPAISVPLPASGLTSGNTYHLVLSQQGGDENNYLLTQLDQNVYTGNPTAKYRARFGGSGWTPTTAGQAIPLVLFDQAATGQLLHLWADNGAQHTTFVNATTPDNTLLGVLEATQQPAPVLNINPTFTTGTAPWIVTGGTLTQSSAHTHGNLPDAGLLTPSGVDSLSYCESDQVPIYQGHNYTASVWMYSPTGYADCAVNINWHDINGNFLSRVTGTVTAVAAGTWTELTTTSTGGIPASAAYASIIVVESNTPPATALLYFYAAIQDTSGPMLPSVAQLNYSGTTPIGATPL